MNKPLSGNSVDKNRKRTRQLPALATTAMLLVSAISFAGFAVVPQAFATEDKWWKHHDDEEETTIQQLIEQLSAQIVVADGDVSNVSQETAQIAEQFADGEGDIIQGILQESAQIVESGGDVSDVSQSTAQVASQSAGELLEDEEE